MGKDGDESRRYMPPVYGTGTGNIVRKNDASESSDTTEDGTGTTVNQTSETDSDKDSSETTDSDSADESDAKSADCEFKTWLEVLPAKGGMLLAVLIAEIMTDGLTPIQMGLLGAFIASVGDLISFKATHDSLGDN